MDQAIRDQLLDVLISIDALKDRQGRELLLRGLPTLAAASMPRSETTRVDLDTIIDNADKWGWIEESGQWALNMVIHNARRLVPETEQDRQLVAVDEQLSAGSEIIRQQYREALINEFKDHTIRGFAPQVGGRVLSLPLAKIFLPLQALEGRPALAEYAEDDLRRQANDDLLDGFSWQQQQTELERRYAQLSARQAVQRPLGLAELLRERRAILLGDPGTGKTTVTRYVAYALAAHDNTHVGESVSGLLPVLVRLANYGRAFEADRTLHLVEYIEKELTPRQEFGRCLREAVRQGECLIILDGLDEVTDPSLRQEVTERIQSLVSHFRDNRFLVTSRIVGYERSPLTRDFKHATLQELEPKDKERFVQLWYEAIRNESGDGPHLEGEADLLRALRDKPQISRMAANPLLLTIIVLMHWRGVRLPSRRVQVYQNATDTLIEYWRQERVALDAEEIKAILAPIAHYILSTNVGGVIARQELLPRFYSGIMEQRGGSEQNAERIGRGLLEQLGEQSGIFLERGLDADHQPVYGFLHQTFGEYLAALQLAAEALRNEFVLEQYIHRSVWHEALLLMAGHLSLVSSTHVNNLLREILDFPCPYDAVLQRNVLLAADCLADDIAVKPALSQEIIGKLTVLLCNPVSQIRRAVVDCVRRLAVTRHAEFVTNQVKRLLDNGDIALESNNVRLSIATALIYCHELDMAKTLLSNFPVYDQEAQRLKFEFWPSEAMSLVLDLKIRNSLRIGIGESLKQCSNSRSPFKPSIHRAFALVFS